MAVFSDLKKYERGIYKHTEGVFLGGHSVKIVGFTRDHWIVENSWGKDWGENGHFNIGYGENEIDLMAATCEAL